jgi:hypothetical protein
MKSYCDSSLDGNYTSQDFHLYMADLVTHVDEKELCI